MRLIWSRVGHFYSAFLFGKVGAHVDPPTTYDKIKLKCLGTKYKEKLMYAMKVYYEDIKIILNIPRKI